MSDLLLKVHPGLLARWRTAYPSADITRFVSEAMAQAIREKDRADEEVRWSRLGLAGRERTIG